MHNWQVFQDTFLGSNVLNINWAETDFKAVSISYIMILILAVDFNSTNLEVMSKQELIQHKLQECKRGRN